MPSITCSKCGGRILFDTTEDMSHADRAALTCEDEEPCKAREVLANKKGSARRSARGHVETYERGQYDADGHRMVSINKEAVRIA